MPTVRTTCPTCAVINVEAWAVTVRRRRGEGQAECSFVCPACVTEVVHPVADRMVPALIGAGCAVEDLSDSRVNHPSGPGLTEQEIAAFVEALGRDDWFEHLNC